MLFYRTLTTSVCAATALFATQAVAEVSAADVWEDWLGMMSGYGPDSVSFTVDDSTPGILVINDLVANIDLNTIGDFPSEEDIDGLRLIADLGRLTFAEQGDGTVRVSVTDTVPLTLTDEDGSKMTLMLTLQDLVTIASGTAENTNYAVSATRYGVTLDEISSPEFNGSLDLRINANMMTGNYVMAEGDVQQIDYDLAVESLDFIFDVDDPENGMAGVFSGKLDGLTTKAAMAIPEGESLGSPTLMMAEGFDLDAAYAFAGMQAVFDVSQDGETVQGALTSGGGNVATTIGAGGTNYNGTSRDLNITVNAATLPVPVDVTLAEYAFGFAMPSARADGPQDLGLLVNLEELAVNEDVWMLGDPSGALPHDPITLTIDLLGKANLFVDIMDPEQVARLNGVPGELLEMSLRKLTLKAAGAEITGAGDFTFDNSDLETFDGFPRPEGEVTFNINGANKLIDSLVGMGLIPQDQAMMGRMMMGMFARSVGEDQLTSTIEVNEQGQVLANGQRLR